MFLSKYHVCVLAWPLRQIHLSVLWICSAPIIQTALLLIRKQKFKPSVISAMLTLWPSEAKLYFHGTREDHMGTVTWHGIITFHGHGHMARGQ